ncbi:SRPBCC family protein [Nocardia sp. alder85J]|uniref:SRPBCC family protein n=1 Tax=Nocardia sp. alder85J TaxID=2862949 RepID=UPI001CD48672|nr:SRPBCC domain-containing protein [Nocardia sp. alder85J]MCX4094868.1 SRPBCC domain-containing protein [Nocardia sp. alder85J]
MTDDLTTIELDHFYPHPPEKVWKALTTPELFARWLMPATGFEPVPGNEFRMQTQPMPGAGFSGNVRGTVLEAIAPKRLSMTWNDAESDIETGWVITWQLEPEGTGTRVLFSHSGFDPDDVRAQRVRTIMSKGWSGIATSLGAVIDSF